MNKAVKAKWVTLLRSGKLPQTKGFLHVVQSKHHDTPVGFCCLGVLCVLAPNKLLGVPGEPIKEHAIGDGIIIESIKGDSILNTFWGSLNYDVRKWAGLAPRHVLKLIEMNDGGKSFEEIADWIEANL